MNGKKSAGGVGVIAAILFVSLVIVLLRDRDAGLLSSVLKTALIVGAVLAGIIIIAVAAAIIFVKKDDQAKRTQEILSKPLRKFSDTDTAELERKYGEEPETPPGMPYDDPHTTNYSSSRKFSREEYERKKKPEESNEKEN
ncbi:MAG: hypothetical protein K6G90_12565 [Clostridia bacterium]|nr:hypothetical protein [Clostridia bacterium]